VDGLSDDARVALADLMVKDAAFVGSTLPATSLLKYRKECEVAAETVKGAR
jgi:hypothetical protein